MKSSLYIAILLFLLVGASFSASAQATAFVHTANAANISQNWSYLDNPQLNGNPNKIIQITPLVSNNRRQIGVWYDASRQKWAVFNQDLSQMAANSGFHVVALDGGFAHQATTNSISGNYTIIDNPASNNNASAMLFVTPVYNPNGAGGTYNNHSIGVFYTGSKWAIFNQDMAAMPAGAAFNVNIVGSPQSRTFTVGRDNFNGNLPTSFAQSHDLLLITQNWNPNGASSAYNNAVVQIGVEPDSREWIISANGGKPVNGASFNVYKFSANDNAPQSPDSPQTLRARVTMPKPKVIKLIPDKNFAGIFILKFAEGSHVRTQGKNLTFSKDRVDAEEFRRLSRVVKSAKEAEDEVNQINTIVKSYGDKYGFVAFNTFRKQNQIVTTYDPDPEAQFYEKRQLETSAGEELADLDLYYTIAAPDFKDIAAQEEFMNELNKFDVVESVEAAFLTEGASANTNSSVSLLDPTPDLSGNQNYLNAAPTGIDARYAWTLPGGRGDGVKLIDVEYDWITDHEDFAPAGNLFWGGRPSCAYDGTGSEHGTAVMGVLNAPHNGFGMNGIVPNIRYGLSTVCRPLDWFYAATSHEALFTLLSGESIAGRTHNIVTSYAINDAANALGRGDTLLIEQHTFGPLSGVACGSRCNCSQWEYVAMEYYQHSFDVIRRAAARGVIVVEAAGNGGQNLDAPFYNRRFDPAFRHSGAILVGASNGGDTNRICFSNFGQRVDVQGWGAMIATLGYGNPGSAPWNVGVINRFYRNSFGGTSGASPIVAGAIAAIQGARRAAGYEFLNPAQMRMLLDQTGTPQTRVGTPEDTALRAQGIGRQPNIRAAWNLLTGMTERGDFSGEGVYFIRARHSRKVLDVNIDWFSGQDNGRPVGQFDMHGGDNQKFFAKPTPDGYFNLIAQHSGKCLDVTAGSNAPGARLQQWACNGGANQQFSIEPFGVFYRIRARNSGLYLDIAGASLNNSAALIQWNRNDGENQQFQFIRTR